MIGVFDSGIGGLTVLAELCRAMPGQEFVYLGDTARVPYGTRSPFTVIRYSLQVASHLYDQGIEALVIACNTATAHALPALEEAGKAVNIEVFGVVEPGVQAALSLNRPGAIAILGTEGAIKGGAYQRALVQRSPNTSIQAVACPLFVPLVEEGWKSGEVPRLVAEHYLGKLRGQVGTAILGCTHYPVLKGVIQETLPEVALVDSAEVTAQVVLKKLGPGKGAGSVRFQATDHIERFQRVGEIFMGQRPENVEWVDLGPAKGPFALLGNYSHPGVGV